MMRLMGAVELGRKVRRLEQLSIGLELLERELWERGSPLPQVLEELSLRTGEPASTLFAQCAAACGRLDYEPFPDVWRRLVTELEGLTPEGRAALLPLGEVLGRYEAQGPGPLRPGTGAGAGRGGEAAHGPGVPGPGAERRRVSGHFAPLMEYNTVCGGRPSRGGRHERGMDTWR